MNKFLLVINVIIVVALGFIVFKKLMPVQAATPVTQNTECTYKLDNFKFHYEKEPQEPNVVMVGNSLIETANWNLLLHRNDVVNRGISDDNISCIYQRMNYLKGCTAKICFIEAGIDDLRSSNIDSAFTYYKKIVQASLEQHKIPVINFIIFISSKAVKKWGNKQDYKTINSAVVTFNNKLKEYALLNGIDYIDINNDISQDNILLDKYTTDGVNLTDAAYEIWVRKIEKILANHGI